MKKASVLASLACALLMVLSLAGCATTAAPTTAPATDAPTTAPAATDTPATEAPAASALEGKVVFWSMWSTSEPQAKVIQAAAEQFKTANPKVELDLKFQGRDINKLIKPALESGEQIDIFEQDPSAAMANLKDHLLKLDDLLQAASLDSDGKSVMDSLQPSLVNWVKSLAAPAGLEDGTYAIPQQPYAVLFFYNKDLFAQAGITAVPQTWADFMAACEKLKAIGVEPVTFDDAYRDQFIGGYLSSAMGSDWVDQLVKDKTGDMWKDPIVLQFAKDIQTMNEKGYFSSKIAGNKYPAGQQDLALGQVAMYLNGTWLPNEVSSTTGPDFNWGSFQFPTVPNGSDKGGQQNLCFGAQALLINKASKSPAAAFELVKYLISKQTQSAMATEALAIPATIDTTWPKQLAEAQVAFNNAKVNMPWGFGIDNAADFSSGTVIPGFMDLVTGAVKAEDYATKMADGAKTYYAGK